MMHVRQPPDSKVCGQACVAMLAGCTLEQATVAVGKRGGTCLRDLCRGLGALGVSPGLRVALGRGATPPADARGVARVRRPGARWGGHWVVLTGDGAVMDPASPAPLALPEYVTWLARRGGRLASYLVVADPSAGGGVSTAPAPRPALRGDMTAASPEGAVSFYRANERPYGAFSNLYRRPVVVRGRSFPTVEHAYQSRKARKPEVREWILSAPSPSLVAAAAHSLLHWDVAPGWSRLRYPWMMECLRAKYRQHDDLAQLLVGTTTATLVEAGSVDNEVNRRWGVVAGRGRNLLGRMLMLVRAELGGATYADEELLGLLAHAPSLIAEQAGDGRAPAQLLLARLQSATAEDRRTM